jgi:glycerol-3-phosphate dehydrogenase
MVDTTYLISAVNNMFAGVNITLDHIQSSSAGLYPLFMKKDNRLQNCLEKTKFLN